jgi:ABC-type multidrug transport system permease subunit
VCNYDPHEDLCPAYNLAVTTLVVEIEKLSRRFGSFTAVDSLSLATNAGEVFGLLGSNGAGKSTTIKMLTTPLFFASNAIYPTTIMPTWLKVISHLNPLTYVVDALRTSMLAGSASSFGLGLDYAVILLTTIVMVFIGSRLYPQLGV